MSTQSDPQALKNLENSQSAHQKSATAKPKVVIVGAGFGGLKAAKYLAKHADQVDVLLIDRRNHHLFQPLLYQVAMAGLSPAEIAAPVRSIFAGSKNIEVIMENVNAVNLAARTLTTDFKNVSYDYLILACGSGLSYFGHDDWEDFAPGLKTLEQATEVRRRILTAFEKAEREPDAEKRRQLLTFVIVGGGPTGCELAGALSEITHFTLSRDFKHIDPKHSRIILIEAGPRILVQFSESLSKKARVDLEKMGVQVWANTRVTEINAEGVALGGEFIKAKTVLWAAGVKPSGLNKTLGLGLDNSGRAIVGSDLTLPEHPEVFVIGDQAAAVDKNGNWLPGLAPVAMQQGAYAAKMILSSLEKRARPPFRYLDKGQMATIGRKKAILQAGKFEMSGSLAWLAWLVIHIFYLIGFKNRIAVISDWMWSYLTYRRGARLIVSRNWKSTVFSKSAPQEQTRNLAKPVDEKVQTSVNAGQINPLAPKF